MKFENYKVIYPKFSIEDWISEIGYLLFIGGFPVAIIAAVILEVVL